LLWGFPYLVDLGVDVTNDPSTLETYTHTPSTEVYELSRLFFIWTLWPLAIPPRAVVAHLECVIRSAIGIPLTRIFVKKLNGTSLSSLGLETTQFAHAVAGCGAKNRLLLNWPVVRG
jgi:predicted neutral ceramidase superfamily lipid hydrolase